MTLEFVARNDKLHYYGSGFGSVIAIIVITCISMNILYHYIKIFHRRNDEETQNKTNYILFFILCIVALFICIQYAFIKSNLFTNQPASSFTTLQCAIGFFGAFSAVIIFQSCIYALLLHRIRIAFSHSMYKYSNKIYTFLNITLILIMLIAFIIYYMTMPEIYYILQYIKVKDHTYLYCAAIADPDSWKWTFDFHIRILFVFAQIFYDIVLLYMFTKRLYALQTQMVRQHLNETNNRTRHRIPATSPDISPNVSAANGDKSNVELNVIDINNDKQNDKKLTIEDVSIEIKEKKNESAARIMMLHELIKQHTILIFIIIFSSIIWLILQIFENEEWILEMSWLFMINIICIWLMFASSNKYWKFITKYCCCYICYCNKQRNVNAYCLFCY